MKILKMFLPALFIISVVPACFAEKVDCPENLWMGIIGEATNHGYTGMYAAACVYRNQLDKGIPLGCVALKRKDLDEFVKREGQKKQLMAKEIIRKIFKEGTLDITGGATHYENVEKFGLPCWAKEMRVTAKIGNHTFFAEK